MMDLVIVLVSPALVDEDLESIDRCFLQLRLVEILSSAVFRGFDKLCKRQYFFHYFICTFHGRGEVVSNKNIVMIVVVQILVGKR